MRRILGKSVVVAGVLAVALILVQPAVRASVCVFFVRLLSFETSPNSPAASGLAYNEATNSLVVSINTESASPKH